MRRSIVIAAAALAVGTSLAGAGVVAQAATVPTDGSQLVARLADSRVPADALPAVVPVADFGAGGLDAASSRFVGASAGRSFWVSRDRAGSLCLIAVFGADSTIAASACDSQAAVARRGLVLGFEGSGTAASVAYLVPDAARLSALPAAWSAVGDNVVVAATRSLATAKAAPAELPLGDGSTLTLVP